uniref:Uncharacterized protein n=1 Tax=Clytia hemisphaerica TaxID=252671 RepID=A0A7M5UH76_9CNID
MNFQDLFSTLLLLFAFCFRLKEASKCKRKVPENNHGIQPITFINQEDDLKRDNLLHTFQVLSAEWIVQFKFHLTTINPGWCNIILMTAQPDSIHINSPRYGYRAPSVYIDAQNNRFEISNSVSGRSQYSYFHNGLTQKTIYEMELHQRYKRGGVYKYSIIINGEEVHTADNTQAEQF